MEESCAFLNAGEIAKILKSKEWQEGNNFPPTTWPDTLKVFASICMTYDHPMAIFWGSEFLCYYNDSYANILGDKHPDVLGRPLLEIYPEILPNLSPQLHQVFHLGETLKHPDRPFLLNRKGYIEECYYDYTLSPIHLLDGSIGGVFNVMVETTEKKISERRTRLLDKLVKYQTIPQSLSSCFSGFHSILSEAAPDIPFFLICLQQIDGKCNLISSFGTDQHLEHIDWPVHTVLETGVLHHINNLSEFLSEPITSHFLEPCSEAVIVQIKNSTAASSGYMVAGISPRKKFDDEYQRFLSSVATKIERCFDSARSFDDYRELTNEKDNLLAVISHELKTPITAIKAYAQLVERGLIKGNYDTTVELIKKLGLKAAKLDQIVSDIVDGTSFKTGKISIHKNEFDFDQMVSSQVTASKNSGTKHAFIFNFNVNQPCVGDQKRLEQVVAHLISNAVNYSPNETNIEITTSVEHDKLLFSIRDYGSGIKPEEQEKIFDHFYRSVDLKQYAVPGIGLGLFISREIINHSGGQIWLESKPYEGSTFHFSLPI